MQTIQISPAPPSTPSHAKSMPLSSEVENETLDSPLFALLLGGELLATQPAVDQGEIQQLPGQKQPAAQELKVATEPNAALTALSLTLQHPASGSGPGRLNTRELAATAIPAPEIRQASFAPLTEPNQPISPDTPAADKPGTLLVAQAPPPAPVHGPTSYPTIAEIGMPVGLATWGEEMGEKVVWMATQREQVAELRLNPPELGPLEIVMSLSKDPAEPATVHFASAHAAVREAVEAALPRLREMMAEAGIALGNATVTSDSAQHHASPGDRRRSAAMPDFKPSETAQNPVSDIIAERRGIGLIDTFA